jgi:hypothetical protein
MPSRGRPKDRFSGRQRGHVPNDDTRIRSPEAAHALPLLRPTSRQIVGLRRTNCQDISTQYYSIVYRVQRTHCRLLDRVVTPHFPVDFRRGLLLQREDAGLQEFGRDVV